MAPLVPADALQGNLRDLALNPVEPIIRGTGQRPDIYMQGTVAANRFYKACPQIVQETMDEVGALTGRNYSLYEYYGHPEADRVIVAMGSATSTMEEVADYLNDAGERVGVMKVRLFRPFAADQFVNAFPESARNITVLDRTREDGALGCPLYLDTCVAFSEAGDRRNLTAGQFGLASKEFTPAMVKAVYDNMLQDVPKNHFVVGIKDDVTNTSLDYGADIDCVPKGTTQCLFWGFGTDGTVGANKQAIKTIGDNTDLYTQGHFAYDSHKGGGVTMSHVRFGPKPIKSEYEICRDADYIACHHSSYVHKFDLLKTAKPGGMFVLNWSWPLEELEQRVPNGMKEQIAKNKLQFYTIDATRIAADAGLGQRINMVMQAAFYNLSGVLEPDTAIKLLKQDIENVYGKKGPKVVKMNIDAVDQTLAALQKYEYPATWLDATTNPAHANSRTYVTTLPHADACAVPRCSHDAHAPPPPHADGASSAREPRRVQIRRATPAGQLQARPGQAQRGQLVRREGDAPRDSAQGRRPARVCLRAGRVHACRHHQVREARHRGGGAGVDPRQVHPVQLLHHRVPARRHSPVPVHQGRVEGGAVRV